MTIAAHIHEVWPPEPDAAAFRAGLPQENCTVDLRIRV
jgi:hypothetical protein